MLNVNANKSILESEISVVKPITGEMVEGKDYINIFRGSDTELGRRLSLGFTNKFNTFLGVTMTMKGFMMAIRVKGYPIHLVSKTRIKPSDFNFNTARSSKVPNYWALVAYALCEKVKADGKLRALMKANELPYTSFEVTKTQQFFNKTIQTTVPKNTMGKYIGICTHVGKMLKEGKFTEEGIKEFIEACKERPDKDLLDGIACEISIQPSQQA